MTILASHTNTILTSQPRKQNRDKHTTASGLQVFKKIRAVSSKSGQSVLLPQKDNMLLSYICSKPAAVFFDRQSLRA